MAVSNEDRGVSKLIRMYASLKSSSRDSAPGQELLNISREDLGLAKRCEDGSVRTPTRTVYMEFGKGGVAYTTNESKENTFVTVQLEGVLDRDELDGVHIALYYGRVQYLSKMVFRGYGGWKPSEMSATTDTYLSDLLHREIFNRTVEIVEGTLSRGLQ